MRLFKKIYNWFFVVVDKEEDIKRDIKYKIKDKRIFSNGWCLLTDGFGRDYLSCDGLKEQKSICPFWKK